MTQPETGRELPFNFTVRNPNSPKNILRTATNPFDFFCLLFTDMVMQTILNNTNDYARHFIESEEVQTWINNLPHSRYKKWPDGRMTMEQLKKYLGLCINMGVTEKKRFASYWTARNS